MAGEWLKFECSLPDKPETLAITVAMGWDDPDLTVGKLMRVFRWFDQQTVAGNAPGVSPALLDRLIGVSGFVDAMVDVGWMVVEGKGLTLNNFDRHNGKTAKNRALTAKRVANHKTNGEGNAETNGGSVSRALPKEEKRREEYSVPYGTGGTPPTDAERVWANGVPLLTAAGVKESNARSMLGGLCKSHGESAVADAIQRCAVEGAVAPVAWLQAALKAKPAQNKQEALEAANREVVRRALEKDSYANH